MKAIEEIRMEVGSINEFILTKEYNRFQEFASACLEYGYIGLCYGESGVGKSLAAKYFSKWNEIIIQENLVDEITEERRKTINECRGILVTAPVTNTPKIMQNLVSLRASHYGYAYLKATGEKDIIQIAFNAGKSCPLVIVDEADRLNINSLEELRYLYDENRFGLILIGMPGIEKRLARYPQLYSRVGFCHEFNALSKDEMQFIFPKIWKSFELNYDPNHFPDVEALNTLIRFTNGNFRLVDRLFSQIKRILKLNKLDGITKEVVETARKCLVFGDPE